MPPSSSSLISRLCSGFTSPIGGAPTLADTADVIPIGGVAVASFTAAAICVGGFKVWVVGGAVLDGSTWAPPPIGLTSGGGGVDGRLLPLPCQDFLLSCFTDDRIL